MSELRPTDSLRVDEPVEFSDWNDLWNSLNSRGTTFNGIKDIEKFILSPRVSRLVQRTRFIEAYQYQRPSSNSVGCVLFLVDMFGQPEKGERYLAIGPAIPAFHGPQPDVVLSSPAQWLRISDQGENRASFIKRQFGSGDIVINYTWDLQQKSIDVSKFISLTCEPVHDLHSLPPQHQFLMWATSFKAFYSILGCNGSYDQTKAVQQGASSEATLRSIQTHKNAFHVTTGTSLAQLVAYFRAEGLHDYTDADFERAPGGRYAVFNSLLADVYKITLSNGDQVAVKCVRFYHVNQASNLRNRLES